jgi:glycosyltransferase involved in cell wall biosynthesis
MGGVMAGVRKPRVSVFVPVFNRARVLPVAIESVLGQTFGDYELLVVDDGSTDGSADVVRSYGDARIRLVVSRSNQGIPRTRNLGIELARGEYLANVDSDDYSFPQRLARQVAFLDAHIGIAAVGSWALRMDESGRRLRGPLLRPTRPRAIRGRMLFGTCFKNPTMLARTEVLREFGFREQFVICSDIDLWSRVSDKYPLANLPEFLVRYRAGGTTHHPEAPRAAMRRQLARDMLAGFGVDCDERDVERHVALRNLSGFRPTRDFLGWAEQWLERLVQANARSRRYPEPEFASAAAERWLLLQLKALGAGLWPAGIGYVASRARALAGAVPDYVAQGLGYLGGHLRCRAEGISGLVAEPRSEGPHATVPVMRQKRPAT